MWRILIPDRLPPPADIEQAVFGTDTTFLMPLAQRTEAVPEPHWPQADAILLWHEVFLNAETIQKLERCKVVVRIGVGFDNVDLVAAGQRGIYVCNVPDYGTEDVADHALAMMLSLSRGLPGYAVAARADRWSWEAAGELRRLRGQTLGIVGLGRIGTAVALRARAFGLNIVFYDPYKADGYDKSLGIVRMRELTDLVSRSNIVTLHTPLTDETHAMAGRSFFAALPRGAIFINTARGGCYDLDELHNAMKDGHVRGAGLDVFPDEPPNPRHPLIAAWKEQDPWLAGRLIITPHAAFWNRDSYTEMRRKAAEEALRVLNGQQPLNCVNRQWL
jgi:phosphoglycerate dehydrogenase-like enzyme